jgi:hypothetical protein
MLTKTLTAFFLALGVFGLMSFKKTTADTHGNY